MIDLSPSDLKPTASGELNAAVGDLEICYETFGAQDSPPLLLIMGLAAQMILWDDEFCELLAARGFRVIRFDNRDIGRSTLLRGTPIPKRWQLLTRRGSAGAYTLDDMAEDAVGLLDHLQIGAAHVVGASMGGMIAQLIAINHPDRILSLVSIMSTTGNRRVGRPQPRMFRRMLRKSPRQREAYIDDHIETYRAIGSSKFDFEEQHKRARAARCFDRGNYPAGTHVSSGDCGRAGPDRKACRSQGPDDRDPRRRGSARGRIRGARYRRGDCGRQAHHPPGHGT